MSDVVMDGNNGCGSFFVFNVHFDHRGVQARIESSCLILKKIKQIAADDPFFNARWPHMSRLCFCRAFVSPIVIELAFAG